MIRLQIVISLGLLSGFHPAVAAVFIQISEVQDGLVVEASGSFDFVGNNTLGSGAVTSGLSGTGNESIAFGEAPSNIIVGSVSVLPNFSGPSSLFLERDALSDTNTGDGFFFSALGALILPSSYVLGSEIESSAFYSNESISSLGLVPGVTSWSWSEEGNSDSLQLSVIPEPDILLPLSCATIAVLVSRKRLCGIEQAVPPKSDRAGG